MPGHQKQQHGRQQYLVGAGLGGGVGQGVGEGEGLRLLVGWVPAPKTGQDARSRALHTYKPVRVLS